MSIGGFGKLQHILENLEGLVHTECCMAHRKALKRP